MNTKILKLLFILVALFSSIQISYGQAVTTFTGTAGTSGSTDGTGAAARFNSPSDIVFDASGNAFVADYANHTIRKITPAGIVTTFAGLAGALGNTDGTGAAARFESPYYLAFDAGGDLFVSCTMGDNIRRITPAGVVTTFAGSTTSAFGTANGTGTAARFNAPTGLAFDASGNLFVAETNNNSIRKITPAGVVTTFVTGLSSPGGLAFDASGDLFVTNANTIIKITPAGVITTLATGFNFPTGITIDANGDFFVTEFLNHAIRKVTPAGVVTTVAGTVGTSGSTNATGTAAKFNQPLDGSFDALGNFFVAEFGNHTIRKIDLVPCIAPTAQVTGLSFGTVTSSSIQLNSFTTPAGGATGYIIKVNTVNTFTAPTDAATLPTTNTVYGGGEQVVFAGTSNTGVTVTGLNSSTQYFYKVFAYNDCAGTNTFETTGVVTNATTSGGGGCLVITPPVGTDNYWMGCTSSDWNTATNWSAGTVPLATENIYVPVGTANDLVIGTTVTCAKMTVQIGAKCKVDYNAGGKLVVQF